MNFTSVLFPYKHYEKVCFWKITGSAAYNCKIFCQVDRFQKASFDSLNSSVHLVERK